MSRVNKHPCGICAVCVIVTHWFMFTGSWIKQAQPVGLHYVFFPDTLLDQQPDPTLVDWCIIINLTMLWMHYCDVMCVIATQIMINLIICLTDCSGQSFRKTYRFCITGSLCGESPTACRIPLTIGCQLDENHDKCHKWLWHMFMYSILSFLNTANQNTPIALCDKL